MKFFMNITKLELQALIDKDYNISQLSKHYNVNRNKMSRFLKSYNLKTNSQSGKKWTDEDLISTIKNTNTSLTDVLRKMGLSLNGRTYSRLKQRISDLKIDVSHFTGYKRPVKPLKFLSDSEIFKSDSELYTGSIKKAVQDRNLLPYRCSMCDLGSVWQGKDIVLQLDHINGISNDHRLTNLRFLCPNCHSQTKTWGNKRQGLKCTSYNSEILSGSKDECCELKNVKPKTDKVIKKCKVCDDNVKSLENDYCSTYCYNSSRKLFDIDEKVLNLVNSLPMYKAAKQLNISDVGLRKKLINSGYEKINKKWVAT